jgi:dTDP-4-dehydrorhamnose reductase
MRIAVFGSNGLLGSNICSYFSKKDNCKVLALDRTIDIRNYNAVLSAIEDTKPDFCINAIALSDPDNCELSPQEAFDVNYVGAVNITNAAAKYNGLSVHFSSDYVFSGVKSEYSESDLPDPLQFYGKTKMALENSLQDRSAVFRLPFLYGVSQAHNRGFINNLCNKIILGENLYISDIRQRYFTWAGDICLYLDELISNYDTGIYNLSSGACYSKHEVSEKVLKIFQDAGINTGSSIMKSDQAKTLAKRPSGQLKLNTNLLIERFGNRFSDIDLVLEYEINAVIKNIAGEKCSGHNSEII